jgi:hypothetical protein
MGRVMATATAEAAVTVRCMICQAVVPYKGRGRKPRYCAEHGRNDHGARLAKRVIPEFIAVDSEGVRRGATVSDAGELTGGRMNCVLVSAGNQSLWSADDDTPLKLSQVLAFLWGEFERHPDAVFIGFSLGFDFAQWLKWLPEDVARSLLTLEGRAERTFETDDGYNYERPAEWGSWRLKMLGNRRLTIARRYGDDRRTMSICDVFGCYQMAFAKAITDLVMDPADRELIEYGKKNLRRITSRDEGKRSIGGRTVGLGQYNVTENKALSALMGELATALASPDLDIRLKRDAWYGPGPIVEKWLSTTDDLLREDLHGVMPLGFLQACRDSYFGGWFEITAHGPVGRIWNYDINSAYPAVMAVLPCLLHATVRHWEPGRDKWKVRDMFGRKGRDLPEPPSPWTLVRADMTGDDPYLGAHMHRTKDGTVLRPHHTNGLIWWHELAAAVRAGLIKSYTVTEAWSLTVTCDCPPPLAGLARLYMTRSAIKAVIKRTKVGNPLEKALKLVYNSCYGKHAQSVGHPKYANPVYASLITAGCRVQILDAIATHPQRSAAVVMIATDGVYFSSPHVKQENGETVPGLPLSGDLGDWKLEVYDGFTIWRPGIYWHDKTRAAIRQVIAGTADQKMLDEAVPKCRGVPRDEAVSLVGHGDRAFADWRPGMDWPEFGMRIEFSMTTLNEALARGKWETGGTVLYDRDPVRLSADPESKRRDVYEDSDGRWRTRPYERDIRSAESQPYTKPIGLPDGDSGESEIVDEVREELNQVMPDPMAVEEFMAALGGDFDVL